MQARFTNKDYIEGLKAEKIEIEERLVAINAALKAFGVLVTPNGANGPHLTQTATASKKHRRLNGEKVENEIIRVLEAYGRSLTVAEVYMLGEFPCQEGALRHAAERNPRLKLLRGEGRVQISLVSS